MKRTALFVFTAIIISFTTAAGNKVGIYQKGYYGKYPGMLPSFLNGSDDDAGIHPFNFPLAQTRQIYKDHFYYQYGIVANDDTLENHISNWGVPVSVDNEWFMKNCKVGFIDSATGKLHYFVRPLYPGEKLYPNLQTRIPEGSDRCGNPILYCPPDEPEELKPGLPLLGDEKKDTLPDVSEMFTNTNTNTNTNTFNPINIMYAPQLGGGGTTTATTSGGGHQKVIQTNGGGNNGGYYYPQQRNSFVRDAGTNALGTFVGTVAADGLEKLIWPNNCYRGGGYCPTYGGGNNGRYRNNRPWRPGTNLGNVAPFWRNKYQTNRGLRGPQIFNPGF